MIAAELHASIMIMADQHHQQQTELATWRKNYKRIGEREIWDVSINLSNNFQFVNVWLWIIRFGSLTAFEWMNEICKTKMEFQCCWHLSSYAPMNSTNCMDFKAEHIFPRQSIRYDFIWSNHRTWCMPCLPLLWNHKQNVNSIFSDSKCERSENCQKIWREKNRRKYLAFCVTMRSKFSGQLPCTRF